MSTAEQNHELGREGVFAVKAWLEATTYLAMPWTAYDNAPKCTRMRLDGVVKRYDLSGQFIGSNQRPVVVEAKAYNVVGKQVAEYTEFLANAYSTTAHEISQIGDTKTEFIWVTSHPFNLARWSALTGRKELEKAVKKHAEWLGPDQAIDPDLLVTVAGRLWLLVRHQRQDEISLSRAELHRIYEHLGRSPL